MSEDDKKMTDAESVPESSATEAAPAGTEPQAVPNAGTESEPVEAAHTEAAHAQAVESRTAEIEGADVEAVQAEAAETGPAKRSTVTRALAAVAAVLVLGLAVGVGLLVTGYLADRATEQARTDAVAAASDQAAAMLSYNYNEVDQQLAAAAEGLTGDFRDEYTTLVQETLAPGAKEKKLTVQATVQAGSVVSASRSDAVVLLFVNQITTSSDVPDGATTGSRVRMEMHKEGDRWLTGRLTPV